MNKQKTGTILAIGGAMTLEATNPIVQKILELAGKTPVILVVPSCTDPKEIAETNDIYQNFFTSLGAKVLFSDPDKATLVFFTGGSQSELVESISGTEFLNIIKNRFNQGELNIAGTSAGCAALSEIMIARGLDEPELTGGLGFLKTMIMDQHFSSGNQQFRKPRITRLWKAVQANPNLTGIGIDENTAAVIRAEQIEETIGVGSVTVVKTVIK